ncbi:MAG: PEGA domain-containing protein [Nitrospirota bacterium]
MKTIKRISAIVVAVLAVVLIGAGTANAQLRVGWGFLFPIPIPLPIYQIPHEPSPVALGLLFPIPVPLPFYDYPYYERASVREAPPYREEGYGFIETRVTPRNTAVYVDGRFYGNTDNYSSRDYALNLPAGRHTVEFRAQGYLPFIADVEITPGGLVEITHYMRPVRPQ